MGSRFLRNRFFDCSGGVQVGVDSWLVTLRVEMLRVDSVFFHRNWLDGHFGYVYITTLVAQICLEVLELLG
ncbi:hypothetical protein SRHO_G00162440 [Serrasalmus rhombeus]